MNFYRIYKQIKGQSRKMDTEILKDRDNKETHAKNERIYQLSNKMNQSTKK
jgi:hypothetical protein